jgi:hypothetical protein
MCKGRAAFAHFSLAHESPIGDNPALSQSGGKRANNTRGRRAQGIRGHKHKTGAGKPETDRKIAGDWLSTRYPHLWK